MNINEQIMAQMEVMADKFRAHGVSLEMPPQSVLTLGTEYVDGEPGKMLTANVKYNSRFANPLQMFQGGFLNAIFDDAFGPLSYMAAERPAVTIEMSTTFLRPFTAKDEFVLVRADVVAKTKALLVMRAEAKTKDGKLVAISHTSSVIVTDEQLGHQR